MIAAFAATVFVFNSLSALDAAEPKLLPKSNGTETKTDQARWADVRKHRIGGSRRVLRWQAPDVAARPRKNVHKAAPKDAKPKSEPAVLVWGHESAADKKSRVRLTSQLGPIDPFDDPFGDRARQVEESTPQSFPTRTGIQPVEPPTPNEEEPEALLPPPDPFQDDAPNPPAETIPEPFDEEEDTAPAPLDEDAAPAPGDDLAPAPADPGLSPFAPRRPSEPCDRIYNERNCCEEGDRCQHARRRVLKNTIDTISLDISPSFKPDAASKAEEEQARALKLAQSAIRSWRNRDGEVIARGQVTNLRYGRIYIEHEGEVQKVPVRELSDDDWCFLAAWWGVPTECSLGDETFERRDWLASTMTWKASSLCHKPLYFEEVQLERYGHTAGPVLQPALSSAHFFMNIATLPYQMGIHPPNECRYALGYYRPGSCAPWLLPPIPLSIRGGLMEAGAILGGIYTIP